MVYRIGIKEIILRQIELARICESITQRICAGVELQEAIGTCGIDEESRI